MCAFHEFLFHRGRGTAAREKWEEFKRGIQKFLHCTRRHNYNRREKKELDVALSFMIYMDYQPGYTPQPPNWKTYWRMVMGLFLSADIWTSRRWLPWHHGQFRWWDVPGAHGFVGLWDTGLQTAGQTAPWARSRKVERPASLICSAWHSHNASELPFPDWDSP